MQTVTKRQLVQKIADETKVQQIQAKEVIQGFLDAIIEELAKGNRLEFRDFGVFEPKEKAKRVARNPRTGDRVEVPAKTTVKFKVGRKMKEEIQRDAQAEAEAAPAPEAAPEGVGQEAGSEVSSSSYNPAT